MKDTEVRERTQRLEDDVQRLGDKLRDLKAELKE